MKNGNVNVMAVENVVVNGKEYEMRAFVIGGMLRGDLVQKMGKGISNFRLEAMEFGKSIQDVFAKLQNIIAQRAEA